MTERDFRDSQFWEDTYPTSNDQRERVRNFVSGVSQLERLQKVILIRFEGGVERLYLLFDLDLDIEKLGDDVGLERVGLVPRPGVIEATDLVVTSDESRVVYDSMNDNFSDSGISVKEWPVPFMMSGGCYEDIAKSTEDLIAANHILLWERPQEPAPAA